MKPKKKEAPPQQKEVPSREQETQAFVVKDKLVLQLFVAGMSEKSMRAIENINALCAEHLHEAFELEIIDIYKHPEIAQQEQIVFSPSLIKRKPTPQKTVVGSLSDTEKVIKALGIKFKE